MNLTSQRLKIKHYTTNDLDDFKAILMSDEIMKPISGKGYSKKITKAKFKQALATNSSSKHLGFFNVTLKENNKLAGFAKLVLIDNDNLEVGYALVKEQRNKGFASEITATLIEHARKHFPEKEIIGIVNIGNIASKNVLIKQNFMLHKTDFLDGFDVEYYKFAK